MARPGNDVLAGNSGHDVLYGGDGNDLLIGGTGNDVLFDGKGLDSMIGEGGSDVFHFGIDPNLDRVVDFVIGTDKMIIDNGWASLSLAAKMATAQFVQSGTSAILQIDNNLTASGGTWENVAIFENSSATSLNANENLIFG
jgi:Ca2+-binding RTX toxin-like protein